MNFQSKLIAKLSMLVVAVTFSAAAISRGVSKGDLLIDHPYAAPILKGVANDSVYFRGINKTKVTWPIACSTQALRDASQYSEHNH
jgi:hypothetical protein